MSNNPFGYSLPGEMPSDDALIERLDKNEEGYDVKISLLHDPRGCCLRLVAETPVFHNGALIKCNSCNNLLRCQEDDAVILRWGRHPVTDHPTVEPADGFRFAMLSYSSILYMKEQAERDVVERGEDASAYMISPDSHIFITRPLEWFDKDSIRAVKLGNGISAVLAKMQDEYLDIDPEDIDISDHDSDLFEIV